MTDRNPVNGDDWLPHYHARPMWKY